MCLLIIRLRDIQISLHHPRPHIKTNMKPMSLLEEAQKWEVLTSFVLYLLNTNNIKYNI